MKVYEVLSRDPRRAQLTNSGQAQIRETEDAKARAELRSELETFVCEGRFKDALQNILESYNTKLGASRQDAAWVSGFFGSGKSHLLKMLTHLWMNTKFEDGATARSLVAGGLPDDVTAALQELDIQAKRIGKPPVAAAGTMLGGNLDYVRHTILSIVLRACGWPAQYPQASFCFWLREEGKLDAVKTAVEAAGKTWLRELNNLYVSPVIANALLENMRGFADDVGAVHRLFLQQFPATKSDITTDEFVAAMRRALCDDDEVPPTILVLDEVQQYINEDSDRATVISEAAEAIQTQFNSRVILVGAGQSALGGETPNLMRLRDRFRITVELSDADVTRVTRKVLLAKNPSAVAAVNELFDGYAGEVERHLQGTPLGTRGEDRETNAIDYPLLCTRRRFWEECFRTVDAAGTRSQLRSQLRILHDSLHALAEQPLGAIIPASDLFEALAADLVSGGVMLNEINTRIQSLRDEPEHGQLKHDLCGLVFLIGKLPRGEGSDLGVRANATTLADLMVRNITQDSGDLREKVASALQQLADDSVLMQVGEEYRLQTTEGAEWDRKFRQQQTKLGSFETEIAHKREELFAREVGAMVDEIKPTQGAAKLRRTLALHRLPEPPAERSNSIYVWLRDGWACTQKEAEADARKLGSSDATIHVFLPKKSAELLRSRIIEAEAAKRVLNEYGTPHSPEGTEARDSMKSRQQSAATARDKIVREVIYAARVFQGGANEKLGENLSEKLKACTEDSLARLFPRFAEGDHRAWPAVMKRAKDGSDQPLKVVDWEEATENHAVAKEVLAVVGAGASGSAIQKQLEAAPYGWPRDAVDAVLLALHRSNHLRALRNGEPVPAGRLDQAGVKAAEFRPEQVRLITSQRVALRGLFGELGVKTQSNEEELRAPEFLQALTDLMHSAGGDAPLPPAPREALVEKLRALTGNEQLAAIHENKTALEDFIKEWERLAKRSGERLPVWRNATALHGHAQGLAVHAEVAPELAAIEKQRLLLKAVDPASPLLAKLATALRAELKKQHIALTAGIAQAEKALAADATWKKLKAGAQDEIKTRVNLAAPPALNVSDDRALRAELGARPLSNWKADIDAIGARLAKALEEAAKHLKKADPAAKTTTVEVRKGTLADESAVNEWLDEHKTKLNEAVRKGAVIVR